MNEPTPEGLAAEARLRKISDEIVELRKSADADGISLLIDLLEFERRTIFEHYFGVVSDSSTEQTQPSLPAEGKSPDTTSNP